MTQLKPLSALLMLILTTASIIGCVTTTPVPTRNQTEISPGMSTPALNIEQLAQKMVDDLDNKFPLSGKKIQLSENSFWQRRTKLNLPFSSVLNDAVGVALSRKGADITMQEVGDEPLILLGAYDVENVMIVTTIKIRIMGDTASSDLALARGKILKSKLNASWFKPEFSRVARSIVRMLDDNFMSHGFYQLDVTIPELKPGMYGQPNLCLEKEFSRFLENAISASPVFRPSGISSNSIVKASIQGKYIDLNDKMRFHVNVRKASGKTITSAVFDVEKKTIPAALLKPCGTEQQTVCIQYQHAPSANISKRSTAVSAFIQNTSEALADHGIITSTCNDSGKKGTMRVVLQMSVRTQMEYGQKATKAILKFKIINKQGRVIGASSESGVTFLPQIDDAAETIVNQIFQDEEIGKNLATIILGRG